MPDRCPRALWVAGCLAVACGGAGTDASLDPKPVSVTPSEGPATLATAVVISGTNFLARPVQSASGGQPTVDTHHRAWIGNVELQDVVWVDAQTLQATVPAGVPPGAQPLVVENALGRRGELASAFLVRPNASLQAALAIGGTIDVGQEATLTLTLTNPGTSPVANVAPAAPSVTVTSGAPAITVVAGPTPSTIASIDPGQSAAFTWTLKGTAAGGATVSASAAGTDGFTQDPVSGSASAPIVVQQRVLAVTAFSVTASGVPQTTLSVGQAVTVTLTLKDNAEAAAAVSASTAVMAGLGTCGASSPPAPLTIASGASATLTWTCTASAPGSAALSATVTATDANTGADVSPVPSSTSITIQTPAALTVTSFLADPPTVKIGEPSTITLALLNTGGATANLTTIAASVNVGSASAGTCTDPSPPPQAIAGGAPMVFTWTCTPFATPTVVAKATVSAVDANSGLNASPAVSPATAISVNP